MQINEVMGSPLQWWSEAADDIEQDLARDGYAALESPGICQSIPAFRQLADAICGPLSEKNPEHEAISEDATATVTRPVQFSKDRKLLWHNENTFAPVWPTRIIFGCQEINAGGQTPTVDMAEVHDRLTQRVRQDFAKFGVAYVRRLGMDLGLDWRQVYNTADPAEAEQKCEQEGASWEWDRRGGVLTTSQRRPAIVRDPASGRLTFVAQVLHWHQRALDADVLDSFGALFAPEEFPRRCTFGDGREIPDGHIEELLQLCQDHEQVIEWRPDRVMVVNNLRRSHARNPYSGMRRLLVAMGQSISAPSIGVYE